jgi:hypothetical protein
MKRIFSEYKTSIKGVAKLCGKTPNEVCEQLILKVKSGEYDLHNPNNASRYAQMLTEGNYLHGDYCHYFIEGKGMRDWLQNASPQLSDMNFGFFITMLRGIVVHFEGSDEYSRIYTAAEWSDGSCGLYIFPSHNEEKPRQTFTITADYLLKPQEIAKDEIRLFSGILAYMACFPDCIHEGLPEGIQHPAHFKKIKSFRVMPQIEHEHGNITPHFRSGHFRVLSSEKFTKKRFQVIFIKECFVKGEAKTVEGIV